MRLQILCALLVLPLLCAVARAEQTQRPPSFGVRLEEKDQPPAESSSLQAPLNDSSNSMAYARSGWSRYRSRQYREALEDFEKAIALNQTNASAYFGLGNCHYGLAEYQPAVESYQQYVRLRSSPEEQYWLGAALLKLRRFSDAEAEFRKAIDLNPTEPRYFDARGYALFELRRCAEAIPVYEQAVSLGGDTVDRCLSLGVCYYRTRNYSQARDWCRKSVSLDSHNFDAWFWLGTALYNLRSNESAVDAFRKAIQIRSDDPVAHTLLGDALFELRRFTQAADAYQEAIRIDPQNYRARYWRGLCLAASFQFADAVPDLEKAHQLRKEDRLTKRALFCAYLMTSQFKKAAGLYPVGFGVGSAALVISFGLGVVLLLQRSFQVTAVEAPGLGFAIAWILICFEGQLVCILMAGLIGLTFASGSVVVGMIAATFPLLVASLAAFPNQAWGAPFARPRPFPWKSVGAASLVLVLILFANAG